MKELYTAPVATIITLAAVEKLAALDGHPDEGIKSTRDTIIGSTSVVTRPGSNPA